MEKTTEFITPEHINIFKETLGALLKKKRFTAKDAGLMEVMVFVANESAYIDMPEVSYDVLEKTREFYRKKATNKQKETIERYFALMYEVDIIHRNCKSIQYLKAFVQERLDSVTWSICQNEHIETALSDKMDTDELLQFSLAHLNALTDKSSIATYKANIKNCIANAETILEFLPVYVVMIQAIAEAYKVPELLFLIDDTVNYLQFADRGNMAKNKIKHYISSLTDAKLKQLNYIFEDFCALSPVTEVPKGLEEIIIEEVSKCATENEYTTYQLHHIFERALKAFESYKEQPEWHQKPINQI